MGVISFNEHENNIDSCEQNVDVSAIRLQVRSLRRTSKMNKFRYYMIIAKRALEVKILHDHSQEGFRS